MRGIRRDGGKLCDVVAILSPQVCGLPTNAVCTSVKKKREDQKATIPSSKIYQEDKRLRCGCMDSEGQGPMNHLIKFYRKSQTQTVRRSAGRDKRIRNR
jgi:hypothetical protein